MTALLGIAGALVGGVIGRTARWYGEGDPVGFAMAVVLLVLYRLVSRGPRRV